ALATFGYFFDRAFEFPYKSPEIIGYFLPLSSAKSSEPFLRPGPKSARPSRAAAVKDGPWFGPPEGLVLDRRGPDCSPMGAGIGYVLVTDPANEIVRLLIDSMPSVITSMMLAGVRELTRRTRGQNLAQVERPCLLIIYAFLTYTS